METAKERKSHKEVIRQMEPQKGTKRHEKGKDEENWEISHKKARKRTKKHKNKKHGKEGLKKVPKNANSVNKKEIGRLATKRHEKARKGKDGENWEISHKKARKSTKENKERQGQVEPQKGTKRHESKKRGKEGLKEVLKSVNKKEIGRLATKRHEKAQKRGSQEINELCDQIRETSFDIHQFLRSGHLEKVYENALTHRLTKSGLDVQQQYPIDVFDEDGTVLGHFIADLLVEECLIVEIKACRTLINEHVAQILGYLRASRFETGLLVNFGAQKLQIKKYLLTHDD